MSDHSHVAKRSVLKRLRSTRVRAVLSLGIVLGFGAVGTMAYWTDSAALTGGTFTAGTLDLKLSGADSDPPAFTSSFSMANMKPGDAKAASVSVQNTGSLPLTYTATGLTTGNSSTIGPLLVFKVVPGGTVVGNTCTGGTSTFNAVFDTSNNVIQTARTIAAGGNETVCVIATLPTTVSIGQGSSSTATFTFNANQV